MLWRLAPGAKFSNQFQYDFFKSHNQNVLCLDQPSNYGRQLRAMEIVCAALVSSEKVMGRYPVLGTQIFI